MGKRLQGSHHPMKNRSNTTRLAAVLVAVSSIAALSTSRAQMYAEVGDAGDTLATSQSTVSSATPYGSPITTIAGTIGTGTDADLYAINITSPSTFSATTSNSLTSTSFDNTLPLDTALFLFNAAGVEIATNDDTSGTNVMSTLAAGNPLYASLAPGLYYLGISISGNEPVNSANQLLFAKSDDSADVRGAEGANNLNPLTLSTFDLDNYDDEIGSYGITLSGVAAVPEPSTWVLTLLGLLVCLQLSSRQRKCRTQA